jgi:ethanolamine utilization protein EutP (predicted NTPase)
MDELSSYQQLRLELADILRAALHVARAYHDDRRERDARELLTRLAAGRFRLAVIGQFSRGKSTLMNALLGGPFLPMGAVPMTSVVTTVRYGSRPRALVRRRRNSLAIEVPVADVAKFVAQQSAQRVQLEVVSVEVELPAEFLRLGYEFIDTPGIGSANAASTAATTRFLPEADAVIFVTGFDSALTAAEGDFLRLAARHAGKLFLVVNKRDLVTDHDAAAVLALVESWMRDHAAVGQSQLFSVSALDALEATMHRDASRLEASGLPPMAQALTGFLTAERGRTLLRNVAAGALDLVGSQHRDLRSGSAQRAAADSASLAGAFDERMAGLKEQQHAVIAAMRDEVAVTLPALLTRRMTTWQAELHELIAAIAREQAASDSYERIAGGSLTSAEAATAVREVAGGWLERRTAEVQELLMQEVARDVGTLLGQARRPRAEGAMIVGTAAAGGAEAEGWSLADLPLLAVPAMDLSFPAEGGGRQSRRRAASIAASRDAAVAAAVADFAQHASAAFEQAAQTWVESLGRQAGNLLASEADTFRRYLRTRPDADDLAVLAELRDRLGSYLLVLADWVPASSTALPAATSAPAADQAGEVSRPCVVCTQLEKALASQLSQDQFTLATRDRDQRQHAESGGYCALHTWQYAYMASPLGIAAAYARLADVVADALDAIGSQAGSPADLAERVGALATDHSCPACAALADLERTEVARLARTSSDTPAGPLCLQHLACVLDSEPAPDVARALTATLAATLRRASADMRAYALKREALQSGLVTTEEADAHAQALRLLAGQPSLVLPWGNAAARSREW